MPKPFRGQLSSSSSTGMLIRADKDRWCRAWYRRLGPTEFFRRRLEWLRITGKRHLTAGFSPIWRNAGSIFDMPRIARGENGK